MSQKYDGSANSKFTGDTITRNELIRRIAAETHFVQDDVRTVMRVFGDIVEQEVADLNHVIISEHLTVYVNKEPGRPVKIHKLALPENEYVNFAFYIFPKLHIEEPYRAAVKKHLMSRISRGEIQNYVRRSNTSSEEENND